MTTSAITMPASTTAAVVTTAAALARDQPRARRLRVTGANVAATISDTRIEAVTVPSKKASQTRMARRPTTASTRQAMALARAVSSGSGVPCDPFLLARVKHTRRQVGLTKAQRQENLQGAFRVPPAARALLKGKRVLLIDDVLTTGSTANAASRALLRSGAAAVDILAFARVVQEL